MDKLISIKESAARLSCSEALLWKMIQQKRLQKVKIGRLTRIKEQDIESIIRLGLSPKVLQPTRKALRPEAGQS